MAKLSTQVIKRSYEMIEEDILNLCLSLSDDKDFQEDVRTCTHQERVEQLESMGFEIPKEVKTWLR